MLESPALPDLSMKDWVTGNAKKKLQDYAAEMSAYASLVEQHERLAKHPERAWLGQKKGIAKLQTKVYKLE